MLALKRAGVEIPEDEACNQVNLNVSDYDIMMLLQERLFPRFIGAALMLPIAEQKKLFSRVASLLATSGQAVDVARYQFFSIVPVTPAYQEMVSESGDEMEFRAIWTHGKDHVAQIELRKEAYLKQASQWGLTRYLKARGYGHQALQIFAGMIRDGAKKEEVIRALNHCTYQRSLSTTPKEAVFKNFTVAELRDIRLMLQGDEDQAPFEHTTWATGAPIEFDSKGLLAPPGGLIQGFAEPQTPGSIETGKKTSPNKRNQAPEAVTPSSKRRLRSDTGSLPVKDPQAPTTFNLVVGAPRKKGKRQSKGKEAAVEEQVGEEQAEESGDELDVVEEIKLPKYAPAPEKEGSMEGCHCNERVPVKVKKQLVSEAAGEDQRVQDLALSKLLHQWLRYRLFEGGLCAKHISILCMDLELREDVDPRVLCARLDYIAHVGIINARLVLNTREWYTTSAEGEESWHFQSLKGLGERARLRPLEEPVLACTVPGLPMLLDDWTMNRLKRDYAEVGFETLVDEAYKPIEWRVDWIVQCYEWHQRKFLDPKDPSQEVYGPNMMFSLPQLLMRQDPQLLCWEIAQRNDPHYQMIAYPTIPRASTKGNSKLRTEDLRPRYLSIEYDNQELRQGKGAVELIAFANMSKCGVQDPSFDDDNIFEESNGTFLPSLELNGLGAVSDALMGRVRWNDPAVLLELTQLFGPKASRKAFLDEWYKRAFAAFVEAYKKFRTAEEVMFKQLSMSKNEHERYMGKKGYPPSGEQSLIERDGEVQIRTTKKVQELATWYNRNTMDQEDFDEKTPRIHGSSAHLLSRKIILACAEPIPSVTEVVSSAPIAMPGPMEGVQETGSAVSSKKAVNPREELDLGFDPDIEDMINTALPGFDIKSDDPSDVLVGVAGPSGSAADRDAWKHVSTTIKADGTEVETFDGGEIASDPEEEEHFTSSDSEDHEPGSEGLPEGTIMEVDPEPGTAAVQRSASAEARELQIAQDEALAKAMEAQMAAAPRRSGRSSK